MALFPGSTAVRQSWGWTLTGSGQKIEVFEEGNNFVITTPRETFYANRFSDCLSLSPGQPGVRRLTPVEAIIISRELKEERRKQKQKKSTP